MLANLGFAATGKVDIDVRNGLVRRGAQLNVTGDSRPRAIGPGLVEENIQSHRTLFTSCLEGIRSSELQNFHTGPINCFADCGAYLGVAVLV